jgi:hypothetical protein
MADNERPLNIKEILSLINNANKVLEHDVYLPSLDKEIHLKTLSANHTKNIAKAAIEGAFSQNQFTLIMYAILKEICDPSIPLTHITTFDKNLICLALRAKNISDELTLTLTTAKGKELEQTVSIKELLQNQQASKYKFDDEEVTVENQSVVLNYPSIEEEYQFENYLYTTRLSTVNERDPKAMKALFGPLFVGNLSQYIKRIVIDGQTIDMTSRRISDRFDVFETLSSKLIKKIIKTIDYTFGKQVLKSLTVEETLVKEKYTGVIEITPAMFLI